MPNKVFIRTILAAAALALTFGVAACNKTNTQQDGAQNQPAQTDNLAPVDGTQTADANNQPQSAPQATQHNYQQPAPAQQTSAAPVAQQYAPQNQDDSNSQSDGSYQDASYGQPVLQAQEPPPALPEYSQPPCPGNGYLWTPGYWATTGCRARGRGHRKWASCGPRDIGDLWAVCIATTTDPGDNMSATTAALITDTGTAALDTRAAIGAETASTTTVPSITSTSRT
jgi:hypothetical protein